MSTTLDDDLDAFLRHGRTQGWSDATLENYQRKLALLAGHLRHNGRRRSADVMPADLDALLRSQLEAGVAKSTRVQLAVLIRQFFAWLLEHGRILRDPARALPLPDDGEADLPEPPLTEAEVGDLVAALPRASVYDLRNVCLVELLYGCGLRRGEVCRLDLDDVDTQERTLLVRESKWGQTRLLPLMGSALAATLDYLALGRELLRGPDHGAFFLGQYGRRLEAHGVEAVFRRINQERPPGARTVHPHLLRHSIAVHLVRGGADIRHVQALLGHADLNTTKIYLRLVPGRLKEDYEKAMPVIAAGVAGHSL